MSTKKQLLDDHKKLIEHAASTYSSMVPYPVVLSEAYKLANKAADSFDASLGFKFSTHLTSQLKRLSRISTQYGQVVRLPENKQYKLNQLNRIKAELTEELDRPPSVQEMSDRSHINIAEINHILQHRAGEVNLSNLVHTPVFMNNSNDEWLHFVYHDLGDIDRVIFEHKIGFGGKPLMNNEELGKMLKLSPSTVASRANLIAEKVNENWNEE